MEEGCSKRRSPICRLESLPSCVLIDGILEKLDIETLCILSCVSTTLRSSVSQALAALPSLDLTEFYPNCETIGKLVSRCTGVKTLTLDCLRLDGYSIIKGLGQQIEELNLLRCYTLDPFVLQKIGERCPNLRVLVLESCDFVDGFTDRLSEMLLKCNKLESFCLKIQPELDTYSVPITCPSIGYINSMPKTIKSLTLESVYEDQAIAIVSGSPEISVSFLSALQKLSLVLEVITDNLVLSITKSIPHLLELDLQDDPLDDAKPPKDLTNVGLQAIASCPNLKTLFLVRHHTHFPWASFKNVDDIGFVFLSNGCRELESLKLTGFSAVGDVGFASILHSLAKLKKFEAGNAELLTDEAFYDLDKAPCFLTDVKIFSSKFTLAWLRVTSDTMGLLSSKVGLESLNFSSCFKATAPEIESIAFLNRLTSLDLTDTDVTDEGLLALGKGSSPIKSLSLRRCMRITDHGIYLLFNNGGTIRETLSSLDLGMMCITDVAVEVIARSAFAVTELCVKSCRNVTDASINILARKGLCGRNKPLRKLNVANCSISIAHLGLLLEGPLFKGLRWLGVVHTPYYFRVGAGRVFTSAFGEGLVDRRPRLTVCIGGCDDMGCYDQWRSADHHMQLVLSNQAHPSSDAELVSALVEHLYETLMECFRVKVKNVRRYSI